jgi:DNA polymerase-3 subunit gamma/tau
MDVIEIDGASNNKVDQIRELCDSVRYAPGELRFRVLIIDEVHMLAAGAGASFNALLKTIEEPPPHTKFVFATTEVEKVLATVISRCQRFDLKPISDELIVGRLTQIAEAEGIRVEPAALRAIARLADGGMRDSQSILDQMIAFCGDSIGESDVLEVYGLISAATLGELAAAIAAADHRRLLALVDDFDANGRDLVRVLTDLQIRVREALLDSVRSGGRSKLLGSALTTEALTRLLDTLREGEAGLKFGLSERANFEVTLLKAVENSRARAIDSLIRELSGMADALPDDDSGEKKK